MSEAAEIIARIIDPHSFMPDHSGDQLVGDIVKQSREAAIRKAELVIAAVQELEWQDMNSAPKTRSYLVYQPQAKSGRSTLSARVCDISQAGLSRVSTHWRESRPPAASPEDREKILNPYGTTQS
ncbi:hypothetical protein [Agrobacterium larrymoorei]|uniref:hypothetical protein n=1 Tax=Agrobacterium larrymoorei TaxID=160699 RepID=UPI0030BCB835